jgi:biotin synthase
LNEFDSQAERVLSGASIDREEALRLIRADDEDVLRLLAAAYRIRHHHFGNGSA